MPADARGATFTPPEQPLPHGLWLWSAWSRLSRDRPQQGGDMGEAQPRPIPLSAVVMLADLYGYSRAQTRRLDRVVRMLDDIYIQWWHEPQTVAWRKSKRGG